MKKILFIAAHRPDRSPSQRFRFEQYLDYLKANGFDHDFSYLISEDDDKKFYSPGKLRTKTSIFLRSVWKRLRDTWRAGNYDIIFVQREAFLTGSTYFERKFKAAGAKLVYDFDDAIWNLDVSEGNRTFGWLKKPGKTVELIALSDLVIAGNRYLADYAIHHNPNVVIVPTTIDTNRYKPVPRNTDGQICIGWSGSITTMKHFEYALPFLTALKKKFGEKIKIKIIGDGAYMNETLGIRGIPWINNDEVKELAEFDIGIMPLPDDEWAKGKCGLKGLQYMALGIPTVMSPVGVNTEIISDGVNGFLATTTEEWVGCITRLIDSPALRAEIGAAARRTVEQKYSVDAWKDVYVQLMKNLASG
ncbi:MAG TPA: glycosyltransferase family 4 protein [Bacteroidia bacterium]|nr:glycosyltransferase family 4 protein [Bacteroidia bacterium]